MCAAVFGCPFTGCPVFWCTLDRWPLTECPLISYFRSECLFTGHHSIGCPRTMFIFMRLPPIRGISCLSTRPSLSRCPLSRFPLSRCSMGKCPLSRCALSWCPLSRCPLKRYPLTRRPLTKCLSVRCSSTRCPSGRSVLNRCDMRTRPLPVVGVPPGVWGSGQPVSTETVFWLRRPIL